MITFGSQKKSSGVWLLPCLILRIAEAFPSVIKEQLYKVCPFQAEMKNQTIQRIFVDDQTLERQAHKVWFI